MIFGISTACMYPKNLESVIQQYGEDGIQEIEIFVNTFSELSESFIHNVEDALSVYKMKVCAFHPFTSGLEPLMLFSEYERRFNDMLDLYRRYFEIMQRIGAKVFVFHGDHKTSSTPPEIYADRYYRLRQVALPYGGVVAQENVSRCKSGDLDYLKQVISLLKKDISFVFDIKQAVRSGVNPMDVAHVMGERLIHLHANDHDCEHDCLLPGEGMFDFRSLYQYLSLNNCNFTTVIEVYRKNFKDENQLLKSLNFLKQIYKK